MSSEVSFCPLLRDRLWPITRNLCFFQADVRSVLDAWMGWKGKLLRDRHMEPTPRPTQGPLESVLLELLPLSMPEAERYLMIQCENGWTAFFDNHRLGTDVG